MAQWLSLSCPSCKVKLQIKSAYASLRGRCPECGCRIEAPRPQSAAPRSSSKSPAPLELVPMDEEWPEPARLEGDERSAYDLASGPVAAPAPKAAPISPPAEVYELADNELPPLVPQDTGRKSGPSRRPSRRRGEGDEDPSPRPSPRRGEGEDDRRGEGGGDEGEEAITLADVPTTPTVESLVLPEGSDILDRPQPVIPAHPLWEGIYFFPWHSGSIVVWLYLAFDFGMIAVLITIMGMLNQDEEVSARAYTLLVIPLMMVVSLWTGSYGSGCFLRLVEDTAAGSPEIGWPEGGNIIEGLGNFLYMIWLSACACIPGLAAWVLAPDMQWTDYVWWAFPLASWVILFPLLLFSSLAAHTRWVLLSWRVLWALLRKPLAFWLLYVPAVVFLLSSAGLGIWLFIKPNFWQTIGAGFLWAAALIIYGRALGRAGWIITQDGRRKRRKKTTSAEEEEADVPELSWHD